MRKMSITVIAMMDRLGEISNKLDSDNLTPAERMTVLEDADTQMKLAKQFFNGADLVVRGEKLMARNHDVNEVRLNTIIGEE